MDQCEAHKAFDSLWSVTDEIFKYVADIRTILNGAKGPEGEILPSDPPPYENSMPEALIERLNEKVTCLENLNEKRKAVLGEFSTALKSDDLNEKKQIREITSEHASVSPRDNALKSLASYSRARQAALKKSLGLLEESNQKLSDFRRKIAVTHDSGGYSIYGCPSGVEHMFYDALHKSEDLYLQLSEDRVTLLKEGKMFEEAMLKVPHGTKEEISKILNNVEDSYFLIERTRCCSYCELIIPFLDEYLKIQKRFHIKENVVNMTDCIQRSFNKYTQMVEAYNEALQSLADHLII